MLEITRRRDLHEFVNEVVSHTYERLLAGERFDVGQAMLKSYVVEKHPGGGAELRDRHSRLEFLERIVREVDGEIAETEDSRLFLIDVPDEEGDEPPVSFAVDMQDDRYWQFHTMVRTTRADPLIERLTLDGPYLDSAWLPGQYLDSFSRAGSIFKVRVGFDDAALLSNIPKGRHQPALVLTNEGEIQLVDSAAFPQDVEEDDRQDFGGIGDGQSSLALTLKDYVGLRDGLEQLHDTRYLAGAMNITRAEFRYYWNGVLDQFSNARLYNWGKVTASGTSGDAHLDLMGRLVADYRQRIERLESELGCARNGQEAPDQVRVQPANIEYDEVEEFETFVLNLFSGTKPFRLTGTPQFRSSNYAVVSAFDLHARQPLRFEISRHYMTVLVPPGGCGNTIARLYTNLLEHLDADATLYGQDRHAPLFQTG